jgi:hypothetical protein
MKPNAVADAPMIASFAEGSKSMPMTPSRTDSVNINEIAAPFRAPMTKRKTSSRAARVRDRGSVQGRGGNLARPYGVTGVAIEVCGASGVWQLQPETEGDPNDQRQHASDRTFAEA